MARPAPRACVGHALLLLGLHALLGLLQAGTSVAEAHRVPGGSPRAPRVPGSSTPVPAGHVVRSLWEGGPGRAQQETEGAGAVFLPLEHSLELLGYKFGSALYEKASRQLMRARLRRFQEQAIRNAPEALRAQLEKKLAPKDPAALLPSVADLLSGYVVTLSLGTPPQKLRVQYDTGSVVLWVNCECITCPHVSTLLGKLRSYKPKRSSSYATPKCNSKECRALAHEDPSFQADKCAANDGKCFFQVTYGDGGGVLGHALTDRITLPSITGAGSIGGKVAFGCGSKQSGSLLNPSFGIDGLMGSGYGKDTVLYQLHKEKVLDLVESFCLDSRDSKGSHVVLGRGPAPSSLTTIPLILNNFGNGFRPFFYVGLKEMIVGRTAIPSTRKLSAINPKDGSGGVILDSGTSNLAIPKEALHDIVAALARQTKHFFTNTGYGICIVGKKVDRSTFPDIVMVFGSVPWVVSPLTYMKPTVVYSDTGKTTCLGMQETGDATTIIGDTFLADTFVQIDQKARTVSFAPLNCSTGAYFTKTPRA